MIAAEAANFLADGHAKATIIEIPIRRTYVYRSARD